MIFETKSCDLESPIAHIYGPLEQHEAVKHPPLSLYFYHFTPLFTWELL